MPRSFGRRSGRSGSSGRKVAPSAFRQVYQNQHHLRCPHNHRARETVNDIEGWEGIGVLRLDLRV
jgi:hypothetical protein